MCDISPAGWLNARPRFSAADLAHAQGGPLYRGTAPALGAPSASDTLGYPIDLNRPYVNIPGGGIGTEYQMTIPAREVGLPSGWVNVPTIWKGRVQPDGLAALFAKAALARGGKLPTFPTVDKAVEEAKRRSDFIGLARGGGM